MYNMKKLLFALGLLLNFYSLYSQTPVFNYEITLGLSLSRDTVIEPFNGQSATGLGISGNITLNSDSSLIRIIVKSRQNVEYLVFESYPMITDTTSFSFSNECEESCFFDGYVPDSLIIQIKDATMTLDHVSWSDIQYNNALSLQRQAKGNKDSIKVASLSNYILKNDLIWRADKTLFSGLFYSDKKEMWGNKYQTHAFEYYAGGIYSYEPASGEIIHYGYVDNFDWRNRQEANIEGSKYYNGDGGWITPVRCQLGCWNGFDLVCQQKPDDVDECNKLGWTRRNPGTCWIFGPLAQAEALDNLYYNQFFNDDLSEEFVACKDGFVDNYQGKTYLELKYPNYVPDEEYLQYTASNKECNDIHDLHYKVSIDDYHNFSNPSDETMRTKLINKGPISVSNMQDEENNPLRHCMCLVGWGTIDETTGVITGQAPGTIIDESYFGITYWIYKQSEGPYGGHDGYVYMLNTNEDTPQEYYAAYTPIHHTNKTENDRKFYDKDGDGYYFWGIGDKPQNCPGPAEEDGDDSNPGLSPINSNGFCTIINTYKASFEKTWDNWQQVGYDAKDWRRHKGPDPNYNPNNPYSSTGPSGAEDGDYYIYNFSACNGCNLVDFTIESPPIDLTAFCESQIEFYYWKWQNSSTTLKFSTSTDGGTSWSDYDWSGQIANNWTHEILYFPSNVNKVRFTVHTGGDWASDVALDDITIGPRQPAETPISITGQPTWDWNQNIYADVNIEDGATLTITNCTIKMLDKTKINVKNGGTLIVDNATITSLCANHWWQEISVWGDYYESQYPDPYNNGKMYQGKVIFRNGSVIENSDYAVRLWNPGDYFSGGGILQASGSTFRNNRHAAEFVGYHNMHPVTGAPMNNLSYFTSCTFTTDNSYNTGEPFRGFITMNSVEGISITACNFANTSTLTGSAERGYGIYTEDATYNIRAICNSQIAPCPDGSIVPTTFQGLNAGVKALNFGTASKSINVYHAEFTNNSYGVYLKNVNHAIVNCSHFDIGPNTVCPNFTGIGIFLENCEDYTIHNNDFMHTTGGPTGANYIGTLVRYFPSGDAPYDEIYNNTYHGINVGNQAEINNYSIKGNGLYYLYNQNDDNIYDFFVAGEGIAPEQKSLSFPARNLFSNNANNPASDFNNQAAHLINYYYYSLGNPDEEPHNTFGVVKIPTTAYKDPTSACGGSIAPSYVLTSGQIADYSSDFAYNDAKYDSVITLYQTLIDGGSTDSMVNVITSAAQNNSKALISSLLATSPYLSEEALKAAADRYDILSDSILSVILSSNPEELNNQEFIKYLENRNPEISEEIIDYLISISNDTTNKTTLQRKLAYYGIPRTQDAYAIIRSIVHDTVLDTIAFRTWLRNLNGISAYYQVIDSYLEGRNTAAAMTLLDSLPYIFNMNDAELEEYNYYVTVKTLQATLIDEGKNIFEMDSVQIDSLEYIVSYGQGIAVTQAQNILEFGYGRTYSNCAAIAGDPITKDQKIITPESLSSSEASIHTFPNPGRGSVTFVYFVPNADISTSIEISDIRGQIVKVIPVTSYRGQVSWNTRDVISGLYFYNLRSSKYKKTGKIDVIN
jgi:hypothetical protein